MATKNLDFTDKLEKLLSDMEVDKKIFCKNAKINYSTFMTYLAPGSRGRVPEWDQLVKIAKALEKTIDWLLTGIDPTNNTCSVKCDEKLRRLCARVKKVMEPDDGFSKALKANIYAFEESADMKKEIQNIKLTSTKGQDGGMPQEPARSTAKKRKAG